MEFSRQYHLDHQDQTMEIIQDKPNALQFLTKNMLTSPSPHINNLFVKFARRNRIYLTDYERNYFCLLDVDKKKRGLLRYLLSFK